MNRRGRGGADVRRKRHFDTQNSSDEDLLPDLETDSECSDEDHPEQQKSIAEEAADTSADDLESDDLNSLSGKNRMPRLEHD